MPAANRTKSKTEHLGRVPVLPLRDTVHFPGQIHTLHVAREGSRRAVREAMNIGKPVLCLSQRDMAVDDPGVQDLYDVGVISDVLQALPLPDGTLRVVLRANDRALRMRSQRRSGILIAEYGIPEIKRPTASSRMPTRIEAMMRDAVDAFEQALDLNAALPPEALSELIRLTEPGKLADALAHFLPMPPGIKQVLLETYDEVERLTAVSAELHRELEVLQLKRELQERVDSGLGTSHRELLLREQLRAIQMELGEDGLSAELRLWSERIESASMPPEAKLQADRELAKLERYSPHSPEGAVVRGYLETIVGLPWAGVSLDQIDLDAAASVLNREHAGLDEVKERILEYLAVFQLTGRPQGQALCFVGPPGVGKTSIARCIAETMGRKFAHVSLGGLRDEAELRGHRRTYVGAMPGRLMQSIRRTGVRNPVILLDEIDKMTRDDRGDATGALLEALDPSLNAEFSDNYLEVPFDLSDVIFIATANNVHGLPAPLRDRLDCITFPGYTDDERVAICEAHLWPRQAKEHGLDTAIARWDPEALDILVRELSHEIGLRQLERRIAQVCRRIAREWARSGPKPVTVDRAYLERALGPTPSLASDSRQGQVGFCYGLAVSEFGGAALSIESVQLERLGETPRIRLTGLLGQVMEESAETAISLIRRTVDRNSGVAWDCDIHIHIGEGGIPKDGPSAGLALALSIWSAVTGLPLPSGFAAMGEVSLLGAVLPVGAIREKLLAARRSGIVRVVLPEGNRFDAVQLGPGILEGLDLEFVTTFDQAIRLLETGRTAS